jgi:hypothetical protein
MVPSFGAVGRQHIMVGGGGRADSFPHGQGAKERKQKWLGSRHAPDGLKVHSLPRSQPGGQAFHTRAQGHSRSKLQRHTFYFSSFNSALLGFTCLHCKPSCNFYTILQQDLEVILSVLCCHLRAKLLHQPLGLAF